MSDLQGSHPMVRQEGFASPEGKRPPVFEALFDTESFDQVMIDRTLNGIAYIGQGLATLPEDKFTHLPAHDGYSVLNTLLSKYQEAATAEEYFPSSQGSRLLRVSMEVAMQYARVERGIVELSETANDPQKFRDKFNNIAALQADLNQDQRLRVIGTLHRSKGLLRQDRGPMVQFANQINAVGKWLYREYSKE